MVKKTVDATNERLRILIIQPGYRRLKGGNNSTAFRWKRLLIELGHQVRIEEEYTGQRIDILIALHAIKSARSIEQCAKVAPNVRIVVTLTGTDVYGDIRKSSIANQSMELSSAIVVLQKLAKRELPGRHQRKVHVIQQSFESMITKERPDDQFAVCIVGHLRDVKDPMRCAMAVRSLPQKSKIHVNHVGGILEKKYQVRVDRENEKNARYKWMGELSARETHRVIAGSHVLVLSSRSEGGANVISESIIAGTPIIASKIPGSVGLLGKDYGGYFETGNTKHLRSVLLRCEAEPDFYLKLKTQCEKRRYLFLPEREKAALSKMLLGLSQE